MIKGFIWIGIVGLPIKIIVTLVDLLEAIYKVNFHIIFVIFKGFENSYFKNLNNLNIRTRPPRVFGEN